MDDWDSVSDTTPSNSAADPSDVVSTPQPLPQRPSVASDNPGSGSVPHPSPSRQNTAVPLPRPPHRVAFRFSSLNRGMVSAPWLKGAVLVLVIILALVAGGLFEKYASIYTPNTSASVTVGGNATTYANANATATAPAVATAATEQQIYTQITSGTPAVDDPLSDDRNNWGVFTTDWGGQCAFTGGAYHMTLSKQGYVLWCNSGVISNLDNFTLQVGIMIAQGDYSSIVFGQNANGAYSVDIHSNGAYGLFRQLPNNQPDKLGYGLSSAIRQGLNQTNVITLSVHNSQFYFYANQQLLTSDYLSDYTPGGIELAAVSFGEAPTDIAYSNLKVWKL